jgi:general secretion pathway protein F
MRWTKTIPVLGEQIRTYHLARLYRTVGMLLGGGTPLVRALDMARGILPQDLRPALDAARGKIAEGQPLSKAFEEARLTTVVAARMFRVGERSGDMSGIMERIAAFHDDRLAQWIKRFIKVFEPALMALIGILIGGIVLLMYMPIFELAGGVG